FVLFRQHRVPVLRALCVLQRHYRPFLNACLAEPAAQTRSAYSALSRMPDTVRMKTATLLFAFAKIQTLLIIPTGGTITPKSFLRISYVVEQISYRLHV